MLVFALNLSPDKSGWGGTLTLGLILIATSVVLAVTYQSFLDFLEKHSSIVAEIRQAARERKNRALD